MSTTPTTTPTTTHRAAAGRVRPPEEALGRRPGPLRLVRTELRKSVDTRSGRVILLAVLALSVLAAVWRVLHAGEAPVTVRHFLGSTLLPVQLLLPVVGVMAMTSEWTQRTALTTFTLTPRRVPVLVAKIAAAAVLSTAVVLGVVALTLAATWVGGVVGGDSPSYADLARLVGGALVTNALNVSMGAAFGALLPQTAVAVVAFFVAPTLWGTAGTALFRAAAQWLDVYAAFARLSVFDGSHAAQTLVALGAWVVLPLLVGLALANRREVK